MTSYAPSLLVLFASLRKRDWLWIALASACCLLAGGCASLSNPVANGIPVRMLPDDLLASTREGFQPIPLPLLRQPPPKRYELAAGDTLGIYIEGVLGDAESPPPVNLPDSPELPPSVGYPFPLREDGTISLPYVGSIKVAGKTVEEAEKVVVDAYIAKQILRPEDNRILVTLMRPRYIRVLVIRDDSSQRQYTLQTESLLGLGSSQTRIGGGTQGTGMVLELPAYQNDVLNALTRSGGLPGLESTQEVIIQRGYWDQSADPNGQLINVLKQSEAAIAAVPGLAEATADSAKSTVRQTQVHIPMQTRGGPLPFTPQDVILENGDIVIVRNREPEFFYVGGLLPAQEIPLPNDYDLPVLEAVIKARGPVLNGGLNTSNLNGAVVGAGIGNPSPSLLAILRKKPNGGQVTIRVDLNQAMRDPRENILVQAGDVLLLQETPDESVARYFTSVFRLSLFTRALDHGDAGAILNGNVP